MGFMVYHMYAMDWTLFISRCVKYNNLPQQCHLVTSQLDACCKDPLCDFTAIVNHITGKQTVTPRPITTTPKPTSPAPSKSSFYA